MSQPDSELNKNKFSEEEYDAVSSVDIKQDVHNTIKNKVDVAKSFFGIISADITVEEAREERLDFTILSQEELDLEVEKGYHDIVEGKTILAEDAFKDIRKKYEI